MPPDRHHENDFVIDERFVDEWIDFGWSELVAYLAKWAAFARWCHDHNREEQPQDG